MKSLMVTTFLVLVMIVHLLCAEQQESAVGFPHASFFLSLLETGSDHSQKQQDFLKSCSEGNPDSLLKAAVQLLTRDTPLLGAHNVTLAIEILRYSADVQQHPNSQAKLAQLYTQGTPIYSPKRALLYYQQAGESLHHASLYQACVILGQGTSSEESQMIETGQALSTEFVQRDLVGALAYCQAAATFPSEFPDVAYEEQVVEVAKQALEVFYNTIASSNDLSLTQIANIFLFGSHSRLCDEATELWTKAVLSLIQFNATFVETDGSVQDEGLMKEIYHNLKNLLEKHEEQLSDLQVYLALDNINDFLGPLAGLNDGYLLDAASFAESLAFTKLCYKMYAVTEGDAACFNGAAASAISYFRRLKNNNSAEAVRLKANQHQYAATKWTNILQTPRVFHPSLSSKPWWNAMDFSASKKLHEAYQDYSIKQKILQEIEAVIQLQEGNLRGEERVIDSNGEVEESQLNGMQRIFTPYIGVRSKNNKTATEGAGSWSEFGPLYDGLTWSTDRCNVVPTLCNILRNDQSLCSERKISQTAAFTTQKDMWKLCGSGTVVTVLRLRPGSSILPHCGTTNARLIMHFPLIGAEGMRFVVGDETVMNYGGGDGSPIVFDDSFEHHVYHEGSNDRYVVLAVLAHPDLM